MKEAPSIQISRSVAAAVAVTLLLIGSGVSYVVMRMRMSSPPVATVVAPPPPAQMPAGHAADRSKADVQIQLAPDAAERAGIEGATVSSGVATSALRLPGVVEPNAYRQIAITPLVAGRVTRVLVQLGEPVRRGQVLAEVYSSELADAYTEYISARAMLDAHDRELRRTQKLVDIGAASRQELERIHAEHAAQSAKVESARARLELLGAPLPPPEAKAAERRTVENAVAQVRAPIDGTVIERQANVGLNVDPAARLFTVVDLSEVWVIANLYERDFARVRVGDAATVTTSSNPELMVNGRVSYIDPQVAPDTRTAKVRIEVPNPRHELRLGMFADVVVSGRNVDVSSTMVPREAVQSVGDRAFVYLVDPRTPGRYIEREVRLGETTGEQTLVLSGLLTGDNIVSKGSFFLRAERERLGLRPVTAAAYTAPSGPAATAAAEQRRAGQSARIVVDERGFTPSELRLKAGIPARLTLIRTSDKTCATEVMFPSLKIKRALPLNEPVVIEIAPTREPISFACGMDMFKGMLRVE